MVRLKPVTVYDSFSLLHTITYGTPASRSSIHDLAMSKYFVSAAIFGLLTSFSAAVPVPRQRIVRKAISRRALPTYINFDGLEDRQEVLKEAFIDVLQTCDYVLTLAEPDFFTDYFNAEDKDDVYDVLRNIRGSEDNTLGGDVLGSITINGEDFNNGCANDQQLAYTTKEVGRSTIHFCDAMWNNGFKVKNEVTTDSLGDTVSWRMRHIGAGYGPIAVRALMGDDRGRNADNWAWFGTVRLPCHSNRDEMRKKTPYSNNFGR